MSLDAHAAAIIGLRVPTLVLRTKVVVRHTSHPVPAGARFCPACGAPAETEEERPAPFVRGHYEVVAGESEGDEDGTRRVVVAWQYPIKRPQMAPDHALIVMALAETESHRNGGGVEAAIAPLDLNIFSDDLLRQAVLFRSRMEHLGIWDDDGFAIFAVNTSNW